MTLTMQDQHQASVLQLLDSSRTSVGQAAQLLDCSERQGRRLVKRFREKGDAGLVRKSRGKPSIRRLTETSREQAPAVAPAQVDTAQDSALTARRWARRIAEKPGCTIGPLWCRMQRRHPGGPDGPRRRVREPFTWQPKT